ncbi:hypothetical protein B0H14DRAFT_2592614 [Mycena olivaceomarginata]|nr:hypothetical protein B0H14DRAFT_2592614 [Mycena olivaceomarginata]
MATRSLSKCALAAKVDPFKTSASFNPSPTIHPSHNQTIPIFNSRCRQFQITPKLPNIPSNLKPHTQPSVWAPGPLTAPPPPLPPWLTNPAPMTIDVALKREPGSSRVLWGDDKDRRRQRQHGVWEHPSVEQYCPFSVYSRRRLHGKLTRVTLKWPPYATGTVAFFVFQHTARSRSTFRSTPTGSRLMGRWESGV